MEKRKYPRTLHFPWSPGRTGDDKVLDNVKHFEYCEVVVTEKMDGECTSLYSDGTLHARSIDSRDHPSRHWLKADWPAKSHLLLPDEVVIGENVYAEHSIHYDKLPGYFMVFAIVRGDEFLSWDETEYLAGRLGYPSARVIWRGEFDELWIQRLSNYLSPFGPEMEGYVVRDDGSFSWGDFERSVAKFVRKDHVQTDEHWMNKPLVKNGLK